MSASGDFNPPEFGGGAPPGHRGRRPRRGVPLGAALGILGVVLVLGLVAIFTLGRSNPSGSTSFGLPRPTPSVGLPPRTSGTAPSSGAAATGNASVPAGALGSQQPSGPAASGGAGLGGTAGVGGTDDGLDSSPSPAFRVGECVETSGSGHDFDVVQAACSNADYKIIYAFQNESGNVTNDQSQCYTVDGTDDEFENGGAATGYTLYCMNSLTGDYSPRRADVDNCLDAEGEYEVDCTSSRAAWIVVGRLNGTTNTRGCSQFGNYDYSYYWSTPPPFVLCVDKYRH